MQSSLIGKIEKAKRYAQETNGVTFCDFTVKFHGDNSDYDVSFRDGKWGCSCHFFSNWEICSHTMAMEKILASMLPPEALTIQYDTSA
jgi:hypothetical protein